MERKRGIGSSGSNSIENRLQYYNRAALTIYQVYEPMQSKEDLYYAIILYIDGIIKSLIILQTNDQSIYFSCIKSSNL